MEIAHNDRNKHSLNKDYLQETTSEINADNLKSCATWKDMIEDSTTRTKAYLVRKSKIIYDTD